MYHNALLMTERQRM